MSRIVVGVLTSAAWSSNSLPQIPRFAPGEQVGVLQSQLIDEASGIVASRKNPGVLWVHNDSDDTPRIFAINETGKLLGTYRTRGARQRDWEDIAIGPGPDPKKDYLYIGDIGDNKAKRKTITVYRIAEPAVEMDHPAAETAVGPAEAIELEYPDGPRDAETLMVDPLNRDIYIISKRETRSRVYRSAYPQRTNGRTVMVHVADLPWGWAVGGDITPDGQTVVVRGYFNASVWQRSKGQYLRQVFDGEGSRLQLLIEPQGEAICFDSRGRDCYTVCEGTGAPIYLYRRADSARDSP